MVYGIVVANLGVALFRKVVELTTVCIFYIYIFHTYTLLKNLTTTMAMGFM